MNEEVTLRKSLSLFQVVFLGLAWMTPMIYFSVYGVAYQSSHGQLTTAYLLAVIAIGFTAFSYGVMAKRFPTSGSAYTYAKKAIHPHLGFLVGWALLLDYLFSPIIACLTFGIYLHAQFPSIPTSLCVILLNLVLAIVNLLGINFSASLSKLFVLIQAAFIAIFSVFLIRGLMSSSAEIHPLQPFLHSDVSLSTILTGASLICFSFLGFDTITTLAEETKQAEKVIPKAIMLIIAAAGILYLIPSYLTQLLFPNLTFQHVDSAGFEIVRLVGGAGLGALFITVLILAIFTQGLTSVTSASRLLYVMGRDSILPKKLFGYIHPKFQTPSINILVVSGVSFLALTVSLETAVKFVNFGALSAFIFVNLSVIAHCYIKAEKRTWKTTVLYFVFPLLGAGFIVWLLFLLDHVALKMGLIWVGLGAIYYAYRIYRERSIQRQFVALQRGERAS